MEASRRWYRQHRLWLEAFVLVNLAFLSLDIYLAHSMNQFGHAAEYVPLYFSLAAPVVLLVGLVLGEVLGWRSAWRDLGHLVGWVAVGIGLVGTVLHLDSRFFHEHTLRSLVYAAPFAAPLAYTGLGLLLIMNRMVDPESEEWSRWVMLLALGGFVGNFVFSLTDHAQNGFYHATEWIPVGSAAFAVGFLLTPFLTDVTRRYLGLCGAVLAVQAAVGLLGFWYHVRADLRGPSPSWFENFVNGTPALAPLLFPNLALLAGLGLVVLAGQLPAQASTPSALPAPGQELATRQGEA
jgi:hypothetical protein